MNKTLRSLLILSLLLVQMIPLGMNPVSADWTIDGDKVYFENSKIYLSAEPHTIKEDDWVTFEFEAKQDLGYSNLDFYWGFQQPGVQPKKPQIWRNYTHNKTIWRTIDVEAQIQFDYLTDYEVLDIVNYSNYNIIWGNDNNTKLWRIERNGTEYDYIAFLNLTQIDADSVNFWGYIDHREQHTYQDTYFDWATFNKDITVINEDYQGFNKWYAVENQTYTIGKRYKVRAFMDLNIIAKGKYAWAVKPTNLTINQAVDQGKFLWLDPWFDSNYTYYKKLTITNGNNSYPIMINISQDVGNTVNASGHCNNNFSDIRFVDIDNVTELEQYCPYKTDGLFANYWVKLPADVETDNAILMYYGNSTATIKSNGTHVFTDYANYNNYSEFSVTVGSGGNANFVRVGNTLQAWDNSTDTNTYVSYDWTIPQGENYTFIYDAVVNDHAGGDDMHQPRFYTTTNTLVGRIMIPYAASVKQNPKDRKKNGANIAVGSNSLYCGEP